MAQKIRKIVFPVAGLATRFLPATKTVPKELFPLVDKPLLQYAVEEAQEAGIEERSEQCVFLGIDPQMDDLRSDARFQRALAEMGLSSPGGSAPGALAMRLP